MTTEGASVKTCRRCGEKKPLDDFNRHARTLDGRQSYCRTCNRDYIRAWRAASSSGLLWRPAAELREHLYGDPEGHRVAHCW